MVRSTTQRLGQDFKALLAGRAVDDLDGPAGGVDGGPVCRRHRRRRRRSSPERQRAGGCGGPRDQKGAVAILQVGRMDGDGKDQAEGVDEEMTLLAFDFLARIIARRVDVRPPFSAPFTLWLSITAALGEASRPSRSRVMR